MIMWTDAPADVGWDEMAAGISWGEYTPTAREAWQVTRISTPTITASVAEVGLELDVKRATIALDEAWAPYCQAELTCSLPPADVLAIIDPRAGARVFITITQTVHPPNPDVAAQIRTFDLGVRTRRADYTTGELTITAASDEALLQDYARVTGTPYTPGTTSARAAIAYAVERVDATLDAGTADATIDPEASTWVAGLSGWDYVAPIVQAANLRLWCDENRRWHLTEANSLVTGYADLEYRSTITSLSDNIDRAAEWADAVVIEYRWTDSAGEQHVSYDTASDPGFSKTLKLEHPTKKPAAGAAARVLKRVRARGRSVEVRAVSDFGISPAMPAAITMPDAGLVTGAVAALTWSFPEDEMEVRTRDLIDSPPNSWVATPGGVAWSDVEAGVSWTEYALVGEPTPWEAVATGETWSLLPVGTSWTEYEGAA